MLSIAYLFYWTVTCIKNRLQNKYCQTAEDDKDQIADAEKVLSFDPPVYCQRYAAVQQVILDDKWRGNIRKVVDFGCAELSFFVYLKHLFGLHEVLCVDIDADVMEYNKNRVTPFTVDFLCKRKEPLHVEVLCGSIASPDPRLLNVDAVICIEIVEHLFPDTLDALPFNIFHFIEPRIAVFTTPNADFNVLFPNFSGIRHYDHKFEWSRQQFQDWAHNLVVRYPKYSVYFQGIGAGPNGTEHLGACSQMAVFTKESTEVQEDSIKTFLLNADNSDNCLFCSLDFDVTDIISNGVCTYETCSSELKNAHCAHNFLYKEIRVEDYPYSVDNRTKEEIVLEETEYRIHRLTVLSTRFSNYENDRAEIPLHELNSNRNGEFISTSDLRKILEAAGWTIENCDIDGAPTVCVIYINKQSSSSSSSSSLQSSQSNHSQTNFYTEPVDLWGHPGSDLDQNDPSNMWDKVSDKSLESKTEVASNSKTEDPVELIFDSGYQVSSSSIDLCSGLSKDWDSEERHSEETLRTTQSEKQYRKFDMLNYSKSSDGNIFNVRRRKCKQQVVAPVQVEEEQEEIVENGDLANNNRDLEGNNYQPAANVEIDDNAVPRVEDLDEHNQNHEPVDVEDVDDLEEVDSLDDASREALFDPTSEISFPDDQLFLQGEQVAYEAEEQRFEYEFPEWMINLLDEAHVGPDDDDDDDEPAHFYSGGDGIGIHPSGTDIGADDSSSSSSEDAIAITNPPSAADIDANGANVTGNVSEMSLADSGIVVAHSSQPQNGAHE